MVLRKLPSSLALVLMGALGGCTHRLQPADLSVAPVWYRADTVTILRNLGQPSRREREDYGPLGSLTTWFYPHLVLKFQGGAWCDQIQLLDSTDYTPRGVRVGDAVAAVLRAYGRPAGRGKYGDSLWVWYDGPKPWQAIVFVAVRDTVRRITIGQRAFTFM